MKKKSRNLSMLQYLTVLQQEYLIAELRCKIYKKKEHAFYTRLMKGKQEKIQDIADRNNLATIFNDSATQSRVYKSVYRDFGFPNFIYRDEDDRMQREKKDFYYYYKIASSVRVHEENYEFDLVGEVQDASFEDRTVDVFVVGLDKKITYSCELVSRIF